MDVYILWIYFVINHLIKIQPGIVLINYLNQQRRYILDTLRTLQVNVLQALVEIVLDSIGPMIYLCYL